MNDSSNAQSPTGPEENEEFTAFEELTRKILKVPKTAIREDTKQPRKLPRSQPRSV